MPCICHDSSSGQEELDYFLTQPEGKKVMENLRESAALIRKNSIHLECSSKDFRMAFSQCFFHLLEGCDEFN